LLGESGQRAVVRWTRRKLQVLRRGRGVYTKGSDCESPGRGRRRM